MAVVEAGLGGRLDATNVLPSRVTALTSIGLEHTEYLGETELEIAAEKLAVLRDHSILVVGAPRPEVRALAERTASERHAVLVDASQPARRAGLAERAPYLARNLAVADGGGRGDRRPARPPSWWRRWPPRWRCRGGWR